MSVNSDINGMETQPGNTPKTSATVGSILWGYGYDKPNREFANALGVLQSEAEALWKKPLGSLPPEQQLAIVYMRRVSPREACAAVDDRITNLDLGVRLQKMRLRMDDLARMVGLHPRTLRRLVQKAPEDTISSVRQLALLELEERFLLVLRALFMALKQNDKSDGAAPHPANECDT